MSTPISPARDAGENLPELASSQHRTCQKCGDDLEDYASLVEAFEMTGKIICEWCFDEAAGGGE